MCCLCCGCCCFPYSPVCLAYGAHKGSQKFRSAMLTLLKSNEKPDGKTVHSVMDGKSVEFSVTLSTRVS